MNYFGGMENKTVFVHPTAIVDEGARIGTGTRVWHFCHLMPGCDIGERCNIGQNVFIDNNTIIGDGVKIQNNVSVYNGVIVEDDVFLGPSMVFTNVINPRSFIERKDEFKKTIIRKGVSIGANATVLCGIEIVSYAMIGAGAVITKNVLPYSIMTGNPASQSGWISEAGMRLQFNEEGLAICSESKRAYKLKNGIVEPVK